MRTVRFCIKTECQHCCFCVLLAEFEEQSRALQNPLQDSREAHLSAMSRDNQCQQCYFSLLLARLERCCRRVYYSKTYHVKADVSLPVVNVVSMCVIAKQRFLLTTVCSRTGHHARSLDVQLDISSNSSGRAEHKLCIRHTNLDVSSAASLLGW